MTIILLSISVSMNILLFLWALTIKASREEWRNQALHLDHLLCALSPMKSACATWETKSTPGTSTASPTPAPDAD